MPDKTKDLVESILTHSKKESSINILASETQTGFKIPQPGQEEANNFFDKWHGFLNLAGTSAPELQQLLYKYSQIVSSDLTHQRNGIYHNEEKLGIYSIDFPSQDRPDPHVHIRLFRTDYFTHRVLRLVWRHFQNSRHTRVEPHLQNLSVLQPFLTSLGVNALLICQGSQHKEVILTRRSGKIAGSRACYHISMNEGLIPEDNCNGQPCTLTGLRRGLWEELGLDDQLISQSGIKFSDIFLVWDTLEIGLSYIIECPLSWNELCQLEGRDKWLETSSIFSLPADPNVLSQFLESQDFTPHGRFILSQFLKVLPA